MRNAPLQGGALQMDDRQEVQDSTVAPTHDETCWLCRSGESTNRWNLCDRCIAALFRQIRRRREASYRLVPLEDGRRDPAGPVTDGRWTA
jgi:hypothetical protein